MRSLLFNSAFIVAVVLFKCIIYVSGLNIIYGPQQQHMISETFPYIKKCTPALSIVFVIDVTESQFNKLEFAQKSLTSTIELINKEYSDVEYSIMTFTDKPIYPLGFHLPSWTDYCINIKTKFNDTLSKTLSILNSLAIGGGIDFNECQLDALARAALAPQLKWRPDGILPDGTPHIKILVLVTDALTHLPNDAAEAKAEDDYYTDKTIYPFNLNQAQLQNDVNALCEMMEYPYPQDVAKIITENHYLPVIVTAPAYYICGDDQCPYPELELEAYNRGDDSYNDPYIGMEKYYTSLLETMQVTGFVQPVSKTTTNFASDFLNSLKKLTDFNQYCGEIAPTEQKVVPQSPKDLTPCPKCENCQQNDCGCCSDIDIQINVTVH